VISKQVQVNQPRLAEPEDRRQAGVFSLAIEIRVKPIGIPPDY
jgi:hypothetical protein